MHFSSHIAKQFRDVFFGENWTAVNVKDSLADVNFQQATTKIYDLNTIAVLVFHINYYVDVVLKVLLGQDFKASDKYAFDLPPLTSEEDWQNLLTKVYSQAEQFAAELEKIDDEKLLDAFFKYGTYYRNLTGIIEHTHYHLGQIVIIKKILKNK